LFIFHAVYFAYDLLINNNKSVFDDHFRLMGWIHHIGCRHF